MTDTTGKHPSDMTPQEIINEMAAQMGVEDEITPEALEQITTALMDRIGERDMEAEFTEAREAVLTYLNKLEQDDVIGALVAITHQDPAGIIALLGSLVLYWADFLRNKDEDETAETLPAGEMARVTFDSAEKHGHHGPGCGHGHAEPHLRAVPDEADA